MTTRAILLWAVLLGAMPAAAAPAAAPNPDELAAAAIAASNQAFADAYTRRDAAALAALYTAEAQLLPPDGDFVRKRPAIEGFWKSTMLTGVQDMVRTSIEVHGNGTTAYEVGRFRIGGTKGRAVAQGKYITIWKRDGGAWRMYRDIWNASPPPPER